MTPARNATLLDLATSLGVTFHDLSLLDRALTHTSYAHEQKQGCRDHNERLEFLGDTVLDLVVSEYLFYRYPDLPEGDLTKFRAALVCETTLARVAATLQLGRYLLLGKGEEASGGRERTSLLADAFEAVVGAIYLDSGLTVVAHFVISHLQGEISLLERGVYIQDYKTLLQELVQQHPDSRVEYEVIDESGPDHDKVFKVAVHVNEQCKGVGLGKSKKEAEQNAAREAWAALSSALGERR